MNSGKAWTVVLAFVVLCGCGTKPQAKQKSPEEIKQDYRRQADRMQQDIKGNNAK